MYMKQLVSLTEYLAGARREVDEICRHLVLDTFKALNPRSIYLGEIESSGSLAMKSSFGYDTLQIEQWGRIPLSSNIPITASINQDRCIIIQNKDDFFKNFPEVKKLGKVDLNWSSAIAVPILPIGAFFLVLHGQPNADEEFESFLRSVGFLLALSLRNNLDYTSQARSQMSSTKGQQVALTQRQQVILELLAKGFTNGEISREIGYSESLVRQETVAIYAFLGVSGRKELIRHIDSKSLKA